MNKIIYSIKVYQNHHVTHQTSSRVKADTKALAKCLAIEAGFILPTEQLSWKDVGNGVVLSQRSQSSWAIQISSSFENIPLEEKAIADLLKPQALKNLDSIAKYYGISKLEALEKAIDNSLGLLEQPGLGD